MLPRHFVYAPQERRQWRANATGQFAFPRTIRRVAIIGAGPVGLACAHAFLQTNRRAALDNQTPPFSTIRVFEQNASVGGTWQYSDQVDQTVQFPSTNPIPTAWDQAEAGTAANLGQYVGNIYRDLRTNLPTNVMCFPDAAFPNQCPTFPHHPAVLQYVQTYAQTTGVLPLIQFRTRLVHLTWCAASAEWSCQLQSVTEQAPQPTPRVERFDAVIVCIGHFDVPFVPEIPGLSALATSRCPGLPRLLHSRQYKTSDIAQGQRVVVVGGGPSGKDIIREIMPHAAHVYQSVRNPEQVFSLDNFRAWHPGTAGEFTVCAGIQAFDPQSGSVRFTDGQVIPCPDLVIFATGYLYSVPFLPQLSAPELDGAMAKYENSPPLLQSSFPTKEAPTPSNILITNGHQMHNLYYQLFYIPNPTLSFPVLLTKVAPLPMAYYQAQLLARVYAGQVPLPDQAHMYHHHAHEIQDQPPGSLRHLFADQEVDYKNALAEWVDDTDVLDYVSEEWAERRRQAFPLRAKVLGY
ncbi:monooxygenase [Dimargaris verticillata]|uniref:Monooxygenase n=1 Tax=Dimargaris verticillata TaxID=2761393 RepID=A0A9W8E8K5_9FUNG|nr:monooxygenase [Dimargaris verticillata]